MKKQLNPSLKAHLLRRTCYLILLVAVCVIPLALGQRATTKQSAVADPLLLGSGQVATFATGDDPASGTWTVTGSLNTARYYHTATLLLNGMVLVAGGIDNDLNALDSAELYDPTSGTWTVTGSLNTARIAHTATLLSNGMVLVAGGFDSDLNVSASAELYDHANGTWTLTGSLNTARDIHTATLLPNGMVLVAGDLIAPSMLLRARNCTILRAGPGLPPAPSTPHAFITQRRCCPTAWSLLPRDMKAPVSLLPTSSLARNCTILRAEPGLLRAA